MGSDIRWKGLDHEAIHKMINAGPGANASGPPADFWGTLAKGLNDISTRLNDKLADLNVHWEGASSETAIAGMSPLKEWATTAESGSNVMKTSYELQGNYVADARAGVPEPVEVTTPQPSGWAIAGAAGALLTGNAGPAAAVASQAADHENQERAQDEAARKAVEAMTEYESSSDWNADTLGRFEEPPKVVVSTPPPIPNPNAGVVDTSGMNNNNNFNNNSNTTVNNYNNNQVITPTQPPSTHNPVQPPPHTTTPQQNWPTPPQQTPFPPGKPSPPVPLPPPNNGLPPGPGYPGYPGGGPFPPGSNYQQGPGGQGGRGGTSNLGPGRGGPGGPGGFGQHASMDAERQLNRGGPGAGMPGEGMGRGGVGPSGNIGGRGGAAGGGGAPGARGANGEEDEEHETPDYLLETEDVFGDERLVAPSVIGEKPQQQ